MTAEWIETSLGDVVTLQRGIDLPVQDRQPGKVPVVASTGIAGFHNKAAANGPGVVIGRSGSIGGGQFIREDFWPLNTTLWVKDFHGNDPRFCYYLLRSMDFSSLNAGSGVPTLNRNHLHPLPVLRPPLEAQQSIANCLGSIDDKIDLSRRINQTLEAMAQAIFKSWFVDFDPVKAKIAAIEQGQDPLRAAMRAISGKTDAELDQMPREHHDRLAATAALFPDAMEDAAQGSANAASAGRAGAASELGEIPKGWTVGTLDDLCHLNPESWSAKTLPNTVWYVDLANAKGGEISEVQILGEKNIPSRGRRILRYGDTIVGTVRPGNRSFALIGEDGFTGSTGFAVLRPKTPYWLEFVYLVATSETNIERLAHLADGGAYPAVRPEIVVQEDVVIPTQSVAQAFHQHVQPLFSKILVNRKCKKYLENLRDTLLPKLLSGELSVSSLKDRATA